MFVLDQARSSCLQACLLRAWLRTRAGIRILNVTGVQRSVSGRTFTLTRSIVQAKEDRHISPPPYSNRQRPQRSSRDRSRRRRSTPARMLFVNCHAASAELCLAAVSILPCVTGPFDSLVHSLLVALVFFDFTLLAHHSTQLTPRSHRQVSRPYLQRLNRGRGHSGSQEYFKTKTKYAETRVVLPTAAGLLFSIVEQDCACRAGSESCQPSAPSTTNQRRLLGRCVSTDYVQRSVGFTDQSRLLRLSCLHHHHTRTRDLQAGKLER